MMMSELRHTTRTLLLILGLASVALVQGCFHSKSNTTYYTIAGSISNLPASGLVLQNNAGDDLNIATGASSFEFATTVADGGAYAVTVLSQPSGQACTVSNGSGSVSGAAVNDIVVSCLYDGNPVGYYTGTLSVDGGNVIDTTSVHAIFYNNRLMLASFANEANNSTYLYDISMTITGNSYSATSVNYVDGVVTDPSTITDGLINLGAEIKGDLSGTVTGSGSFTLTYVSTVNGQVADVANINREGAELWTGTLPGAETVDHQMEIKSDGTIATAIIPTGSGAFDSCTIISDPDGVSAIPGTSVYDVNNLVTEDCVVSNFSGYAVTTNVNNTVLFFVFLDGSRAGYALYK